MRPRWFLPIVILLTWIIAPMTSGQRATAVTHATVEIATTSTSVLGAASQRTLLGLINSSDTVLYCNLAGGAAIVDGGLRLNANGGSALFDTSVPTGAIACIHGGSGTKTLLVLDGR